MRSYNALSYEVGRMWDRDGRMMSRRGSGTQLRQAVAADPKLHVLIAHGWNDLSCPFMGSIVTVNQIPSRQRAARISSPTNIQAATCFTPVPASQQEPETRRLSNFSASH